jgi:hypothetical protein
MATAKEQIRVWISPETKAFLEQRAEEGHRALSEVACQMLEEREVEIKTTEISPWLVDMLDAVLSKYLHGFSQILDRLVLSAFEEADWTNTQVLKLLEISGIKDPAAQDQRIAAITTQIRAHARAKADEFFQSLNGPEALIEPEFEPAE